MYFRVYEYIRKPQKERTKEVINTYAALSKSEKIPLMQVVQEFERVNE